MNTGRWTGLAIAGLFAMASSSCAHGEKKAQAPPSPAEQSQQALQQAANEQKKAAESEKAAAAAQQDVAKSQQQLTEAQRREQEARASAQQAEIQAGQQLHRANETAEQAQIAAEQAQGLQTVTGNIAQATPSRIMLQMEGGRMQAFNLEQRTKVLVGSERHSFADIQQGADARVSYDPRSSPPTAVVIHLSRVGGSSLSSTGSSVDQPPAPTPAAPPEPLPGQPQPPR